MPKNNTYTTETKRDAIIAMVTTAVNGKPIVKDVQETTGIPRQTLARWYKQVKTNNDEKIITNQEIQEIELLSEETWADHLSRARESTADTLHAVLKETKSRITGDAHSSDIRNLMISQEIALKSTFAAFGEPYGKQVQDINVKGKIDHHHAVVKVPAVEQGDYGRLVEQAEVLQVKDSESG